MSLFTVNHNEAGSGYEPLAEGKYECLISEASVTTFNSGAEGIKVTLTVRSDVGQAGAGRKIFDNLVLTPKAMFKFQQYSKAIELPNGAKIAKLETFVNEIFGKAVLVTVKNETSEYNGNVRVQNKVANVDVSAHKIGTDTSTPFDLPDDAIADVSADDIFK